MHTLKLGDDVGIICTTYGIIYRKPKTHNDLKQGRLQPSKTNLIQIVVYPYVFY